MDDPTDPSAPAWGPARTAKQKSAVQRNVKALLDALAPEHVLTRRESAKLAIEQYRTPGGCILQTAKAALSVSWFENEGNALGELHIVVWSGVVSRRGAPVQKDGATIMKELVFAPIDPPNEGRVWRAADGTEYDTPALAGYCQVILDEQMNREPPRRT